MSLLISFDSTIFTAGMRMPSSKHAAGTVPLDIDKVVCELELLAGGAITIDHCPGALQVFALEQQGLRAQLERLGQST